MLELDWLALGVAVKYQLPLDNSPQSTLMWKRYQAFSTHRRTLMSERLIKTPIRYYFDNIMEGVKKKRIMKTIDWEQRRYEIAKEVFPSLLNVGKKFNENFAATLAINCADVLINRLKKNKGG